MRSSKNRSRSKQNRPRTLGNIINRVFDSSGPEGKVRGTPAQIIEKYQLLARDAQLSNDRVAAENFLQHAEHYTRLLAEATREMAAEQEARQQGGNGSQSGGNRDRDWRDKESGDADEQPYVGALDVIGDEAGLVEEPAQRRDDQNPPRNRDGYQNRDRGSQNRDGQNRDGQNRDGQSRDGQSRDGQSRDHQNRDGQNRDNQNRDNQNREGQNRDGQNRDFNRNRDQNQSRDQNRGNRDQPRAPREERRDDRREELRFDPPAFLTDPLPVVAVSETEVAPREVPIGVVVSSTSEPAPEKAAKPRAPRKKPATKPDTADQTAE